MPSEPKGPQLSPDDYVEVGRILEKIISRINPTHHMNKGDYTVTIIGSTEVSPAIREEVRMRFESKHGWANVTWEGQVLHYSRK